MMMHHHQDRSTIAYIRMYIAMKGVACFVGIRQQTAVSDRQFLRSMIPHHGGAILMCGEASVQHPDVRALCSAIVSSQREEIAIMQRLLERQDIR